MTEVDLPTKDLSIIYFLSVKRGMRTVVPSNWLEQALAIPGIVLVSDQKLPTVTVDATADAIAELSHLLGKYLHIEPMITHRPSQ